MNSRTSLPGWAAVFAIAVAATFSSAINAPFVYDDVTTIVRNETIRTLDPLSVPLNPKPLTSVSGRPVVNLSFALNYAINDALGVGQPPAEPGRHETMGYHVGNMLLHLVCGLLLFAVLRRTLRKVAWSGGVLDAEMLSGLATLIWLVHPIQTATVDYVTSRTEIIVSACLLATLYAAIRGGEAASPGSRAAWRIGAVLFCALGMASKEVMVAAPVLVLLYDRAFLAPSWRAIVTDPGRLFFYVAMFATMAIVVETITSSARSASVGFGMEVSWREYLYSQGWVVGRYLKLLAWPRGLLFDYGDRPIVGFAPLPGFVLLASAAAATVIAWRRPRWLWLGFLGAWFFVLLAPSSSIVPIVTEIGAERRVYLASAAVFVLALLGFDRLCTKLAVRRGRAAVVLGAIAAMLAIGSFVRGRTYASRSTLYADTIAKAPENPRARFSAALALYDEEEPRHEEALALLRSAIALDSSYFDPWHYTGVILLGTDRVPEALRAFQRAAALRVGDRDAHDGIARAFLRLGHPDSAAVHADKIGTYDVELLWTLSGALLDRGRAATAIPFLERAQGAQPSAMGLALIAIAYAETGRAEDAIRAAAQASESGATPAPILTLAARAARVAGRPDLARTYANRALQIDPESAQAKLELEALGRARRP